MTKLIEFALAPIVIGVIYAALPTSPFRLFENYISNSALATYLPYINWLIPISQMLAIMQGWLVCVLVYIVYSIVMRWVKMIK